MDCLANCGVEEDVVCCVLDSFQSSSCNNKFLI